MITTPNDIYSNSCRTFITSTSQCCELNHNFIRSNNSTPYVRPNSSLTRKKRSLYLTRQGFVNCNKVRLTIQSKFNQNPLVFPTKSFAVTISTVIASRAYQNSLAPTVNFSQCSNWRPAGRMRPPKQFYTTRKYISIM